MKRKTSNRVFWQIFLSEVALIALFAILCATMYIRSAKAAKAEANIMDKVYVEMPSGKQVPWVETKYSKIIIKSKTKATPIVRSADYKNDHEEPKILSVKGKIYTQYQRYYLSGLGSQWLNQIQNYYDIIKSATSYAGHDFDLAVGLIAVESEGDPYAQSSANALGLTQILWVPKECFTETMKVLGIREVNLYNPKHNIYLGMIVLRDYTTMKKNDLLMGLLSYNIGPNEPGVVNSLDYFTFTQNAWSDLQQGGKDYVIRVLAMTLMSKVRRQYGEILSYNEENKAKIEAIKLPGLDY